LLTANEARERERETVRTGIEGAEDRKGSWKVRMAQLKYPLGECEILEAVHT
jgi:hypothetical protein